MLLLSILIGSLLLVYIHIFLPWYSQWDTSGNERLQAFPGDEIVAKPVWDYHQAITIHAPVAEVWPWLVQIGQGRGGLYSYELLENMIGCEIYNANQIIPALQNLAAGDTVKLHPEAPGVPVLQVNPNQSLLLGGSDSANATTWAFLLIPVEAQSTRLLVRYRTAYPPTLANQLFQRLFVQPASLFMQKRMLIGIQQRAEGTFVSATSDNIQIILWLVLAVIWAFTLLLILFRRRWLRFFLVGVFTGLMLLGFIAWQPPVFAGILLVIINLAGLVWAIRR